MMKQAKAKGTPGARSRQKRTGAAGHGKANKAPAGPPAKPLSRLRQPESLSLEEWQVALRRQFGVERRFRIRNIGRDPVYSEFEVVNPETERSYRVAIRGEELGENYCSCPDFAVNTLGTCKHIEFLLGRLRKSRKTRAALSAGFRPDYSEIYLHYGPRREVRFRPGTGFPPSLSAEVSRSFDARGILKPGPGDGFHDLLKDAARRHHEIRCYDDALDFLARRRDDAARARRIDRILAGGRPPLSSASRGAGGIFDRLLKTTLYPYQREGALFAARAGRCLIADDMGLGKTVQAIAAVEILARVGTVERVLVISPTSLKHQWQREIDRFSGRSALIVEGLLAERARRYAADSFYKITNYDVVHRDLDEIERWQPDLVILDEAQRIKNWKTRTAKSVKQLRSDHAIVLTGTPLENRLEELYSIVEFVDRFRLGPMFRFLSEHQHLDEHGRVIGYKNLSNIARTLQPILIRRRKEEVLKDLPERLEKRFFVPMTEEQMRHHEENREIVARIVFKWRKHGFLSESDQRRLQIALQNMRMSCDSTYLLDRATDLGVKADELAELLSEILEDPTAKVVVFSQWLRMHELIERRIHRRKWEYVLFHGGVPGRARKELIDRFREDSACRLFLSTDAGGVGLNLQAATVVVNMDQPWNPAVLEQRVGRVHRLGQHRPVRVVHFIAQGTIEEGMLGLLAFKKSMFSGVLEGGQDEVFLGGTRLTQFMKSVEQATGAIPERMPAAAPAGNGDGVEAGVGGGVERGAGVERRAGVERGAGRARVGATDESAGAGKYAGSTEETEERIERAEDTWVEVAAAGAALLEKLGLAIEAGRPGAGRSGAGGRAGAPGSGLVRRDEESGESYLRLPVPRPETLRRIMDLLGAVAKGGR